MKRLITIILIIFSYNSFAGVINVGDTTLSSNWNANGNVLNINGKISGAYQISNAIIQANPFIQIFDTAVTIGSGVQIQRFSAMWYGANAANSDNSRQLQRCIDMCVNRYDLFLPDGNYKTSQPLMIALFSGGVYQQARLNMYGNNSFWSSQCQITYSGDSCAIGLQLNKGSKLHGITISGGWVSPSYSNTIAYYSTPFASYTNQGISGNGVGVWIDPVGNWNHRSGSTGCEFYDLYVKGFKTLFQIGNNITQNDEILLFHDIQLGNAQEGFHGTQPQEKGNRITGIYSWGSIHTIFNLPYPGQQAGNYYIDGANIAGGCVRIFNMAIGGFFPSHIQNIYAENFGTIGNFSTSGLPISIRGSEFDFAVPSVAGTQTLLTSNSNMVKFDDCTFRYYGLGTNLVFSGSATFDNCTFSGTVTGMSNSIFMSYTNGVAGVQNNQTITVTTDTVKSNYIKISLRKSYLSQ